MLMRNAFNKNIICKPKKLWIMIPRIPLFQANISIIKSKNISMSWNRILHISNFTTLYNTMLIIINQFSVYRCCHPCFRYVRSIVFKFKKGKYLLKHQTSSTSTTTTTSTTSYVPPRREKRKAPGTHPHLQTNWMHLS